MKQVIFIPLIWFSAIIVKAQNAVIDSVVTGKVTVIKDSRLNVLAEKEAAFNEALVYATKSGKGYRLMVLSTADRAMAMKVRAQLLQNYPDQKVYMSYQPPYIKLKFGNFLTKEDADNSRKELLKTKLITNNIYLVPENIEIKPDKNREKESENK